MMTRRIFLRVMALLMILLVASGDSVPEMPHDKAHLHHQEHILKRLQDTAATSQNLHASPATAQVLRQEAHVKQLRAELWNNARQNDQQNMTLSDLREMLWHKLHSDPSLTGQSRTDINERLVKVMNILAEQRMKLRQKTESLSAHIEHVARSSPNNASVTKRGQHRQELEKKLTSQ